MPKPKTHRARRQPKRRGARSHFRHWEPGRRPLVPIAWLSPIHSRPTQVNQAAPAAELRRGQGDVDSTYPPLSPRSRLRRRRAERSVEQILLWKRREGSADSVGPAQPSARVHGGGWTLSGRQARSLTWVNCGRLHSSPHSGHTDMAGSAARMPTSGYSVIVSARATDCSRECLCHRSMV